MWHGIWVDPNSEHGAVQRNLKERHLAMVSTPLSASSFPRTLAHRRTHSLWLALVDCHRWNDRNRSLCRIRYGSRSRRTRRCLAIVHHHGYRCLRRHGRPRRNVHPLPRPRSHHPHGHPIRRPRHGFRSRLELLVFMGDHHPCRTQRDSDRHLLLGP